MADMLEAERVLVHLKLEPEMAKSLRRAGKVRGRALPDEIIFRLGASLSGDAGRDRATVLAMLKLALPILFDQLGANEEALTDDHRAIAKMFATSLYNELMRAGENIDTARNPLPEIASAKEPAVLLSSTLDALTVRQREVLSQMMLGLSNKQIARALKLAEGTVKVHVNALFRNLGVRRRTQAAVLGTQLLPPTIPPDDQVQCEQ
jgi:DNA-binding CsgD family transcriptional regulator